ncbi:amidohydrolase [Robiginitalea marina]|uniref:amidohydrolase n=1 Tax=Robiginitalea marina TaxID=2954105 RepID=UPI003514B51C
MEIALVQTSLAWEDPEANRLHFSRLLDPETGRADLIVLPEMFTTGFTMSPQNIPPGEEARSLDWMRETAARTRAAVTGSLVAREGGKYYNRLFFVEPGGAYETYDKRHTFTLAGEDQVYERGRTRKLIHFRGFTICPLICYDLRFPVWSRNTEDYDLLLYVANWPAPRIAAWDALLKARAIENMAYVAGVNRTGTDPNAHRYPGHSAVFDALGTRLAYSEQEEVLHVTLSLEHLSETRKSLRFLQDQDRFTLES